MRRRDKRVCAGSRLVDVNIFWLSHFQLQDGDCPKRLFCILTLSQGCWHLESTHFPMNDSINKEITHHHDYWFYCHFKMALVDPEEEK